MFGFVGDDLVEPLLDLELEVDGRDAGDLADACRGRGSRTRRAGRCVDVLGRARSRVQDRAGLPLDLRLRRGQVGPEREVGVDDRDSGGDGLLDGRHEADRVERDDDEGVELLLGHRVLDLAELAAWRRSRVSNWVTSAPPARPPSSMPSIVAAT